jgi:hypothetical protein
MPKEKRTPEALPSKELVLAAIERAERHRVKRDDPDRYKRRPDRPGVSLSTIKEHLGLAPGGWTTIQLRPTWDGLKQAGLIEHSRRSGFVVWRLTSAGQQQLKAARDAGDIGLLPESPQHRHWRGARSQARERIGEFREDLQAVLADAAGLLDAHKRPDSESWHALRKRLDDACQHMEVATYCLYEWAEPDDSCADIIPIGKVGYRNIPATK